MNAAQMTANFSQTFENVEMTQGDLEVLPIEV